MKIEGLELKPKSLEFITPININGQQVHSKDLCILKLVTSSGEYYGEVSPLPGLHEHNLTKDCEELTKLKSHIIGQTISPEDFNLTETGFNLIKSDLSALTSTALFGIESALLNVLIDNNLIKLNLETGVLYNQLWLPGNSTSALKARILKIKIGRNGINKEIQNIKKVIKENTNVQLRLDGNRLLSQEDLKTYLNELQGHENNIEYFEEPTNNVWDADTFNFPLGLDEGLKTCFTQNKAPKNTVAAIIKPTLFRGLSESIKIAKWAKERDLSVIISSTFESDLGLKGNYQLAKLIDPDGKTAMGLDTHSYIKKTCLTNKARFENNYVYIN